MSDNIAIYKSMGSILARVAFNTLLKKIDSRTISTITVAEFDTLWHALQSSASTLIRARQHYSLDEEELEAFAEGFALSLTHIVVNVSVEHKRATQTIPFDGHIWELVFDPGPGAEDLRTDEKGRVWRKIALDPFVFLDDDSSPF